MEKKRIWRSIFLVMLAVTFFLIMPGKAQAASFEKSQPKIQKAQYLYNSVSLQWSKVTGAKKYVIERREMNPKTGKYGNYKAWATTTKTSIVKKATGDCQYRVQAVKGKSKSKWSASKRVFAACAKIVDRTYEAGGFLTIKVQITNKTKSSMGISKGFEECSTVLFLNKKGKKVDSYTGKLYSGNIYTDDNYLTDTIPANKTKTIYLRSSVSSLAWMNFPMVANPTDLQNHAMKIVTKFNPNPYKENTTLKVTYTKDVKKSVTK